MSDNEETQQIEEAEAETQEVEEQANEESIAIKAKQISSDLQLASSLMCPACNSVQPVRTSIRICTFQKDIKQYCKRCNIMLKHGKALRGGHE